MPMLFDDGHGDYNRSYERDYDDFDYADYSTDHRDNNYRNFEKKRRKSEKEIIKDILNRWDWKIKTTRNAGAFLLTTQKLQSIIALEFFI